MTESKHFLITFITYIVFLFCYGNIVNHLLCLMYKLTFTMYQKKHSIYRVRYYPWFKASTGVTDEGGLLYV